MAKTTSVGQYLVTRLEQVGLKHVFGIPGDYVLKFDDLLVASRMQFVTTCTEAGAAFASDAYARVNGLGALCITYCVGGLNALNAVAGAYAERAPVIVISGAPGLRERVRTPLLHHRVREFDTQRRIYEQVTVASASLDDADRAPEQIDATIRAAIWSKRPVYLELPRDLVNAPCAAPGPWRERTAVSDPAALAEAVAETAALLKVAKRPVVLAGVEIQRWGLQDVLIRLIEKTGLPVATTLLGKSVISERHPQHLGVYMGGMGRDGVRRAVERADCLLFLGDYFTDLNLGIYTAHLDPLRTVYAAQRRVTVKHHHFENVYLGHFIEALAAKGSGFRVQGSEKRKTGDRRQEIEERQDSSSSSLQPPASSLRLAASREARASEGERDFHPRPAQAITVKRFFERMNTFLDDDSTVICDIGDSLFGAADLVIHRKTEFLSSAYYATMGYAVPAAIGAQIGRPKSRPIVFVGDGAFQMTGLELSTVARLDLDPIVFVLNNAGYLTERLINEGPYNDIHDWAYHLVPQVVRKGQGYEVRTEGELEEALEQAKRYAAGFSLINVHVDPKDRSATLDRLGASLSRAAGHR